MQAIVGRKVGMTSIITEDGTVQSVTLIQAAPNVVTQIRNTETDGYNGVQVGTESSKKLTKAQSGHAKKVKTNPKLLKEFRVTEIEHQVGDVVDVSIFEPGQPVKVTGVSKGKGFSGSIKRHNFTRQRKSHGAKGSTRRPGSIGSMYPQKVFKGKRMAGRSGGAQVGVRGLKVSFIDKDHNLIAISGPIPGPKKGVVTVEAV
jgi:large subunit ribosomal protein L3